MGLLLTALAAGCSGSDGGTASGSAAPGTLAVSLTDAPACGYDEVNVTVSRVRVHRSQTADDNAAGWTDITLNPPRKINLLNLNDPTQPNFALENLGETPLPAGHYTQVRLVLVRNANSVVLSTTPPNHNEIPLDTPSGVQSGIKLVNEFDVPSGQRVDLLLDFDACHSIVQRGNGTYALKPVVKVIPYALNGIEGFVDTALLGSNVVVSAQRNGEIIRATVPNAQTGKFFLARLPGYPLPGDYPAHYDVVITARNSPTDTCCATAVITGVPVYSSTSTTPITTLSTSGSPFMLQASTFHRIGDTVTLINPPPPPAVDDLDDATVVVAAKQSLSSGPTVTVRTQVGTLKDDTATVGDYGYGLVLPIAAPSRAPFGPLPIVLSATTEAATAGAYTVYGSATVYDSAQTPIRVYATQVPVPSSVNISAGDRLDQDFTLAP